MSRTAAVEGEHRLDAIRDQVRAGGRRWTVARSAIVTALLDTGRHLSVRRIHETVQARFPEIDQSTESD
jgi:Fe2+ or Zn2+ uptake regulation protein